MAGLVRSDAYKSFLRSLIDLRKTNELSQADLAVILGKPPSFVGKYELGERRLDIVEAIVILERLKVDPFEFLKDQLNTIPKTL